MPLMFQLSMIVLVLRVSLITFGYYNFPFSKLGTIAIWIVAWIRRQEIGFKFDGLASGKLVC